MKDVKPIIGILATSNYLMTNSTFKDTYSYGNNYIKAIYDSGGIPLLIPFYDEKIIKETLDMCDGLILPGGQRVRPVNFEVIDYFVKQHKPILGICLGMQTLAMYSVNLKKEKRIIKPIDSNQNHWPYELTRDNNDVLAHRVNIVKGSQLYNIFGQETIMVNSGHHNTVSEAGPIFDVTIKSSDGLIEGIEYNKKDNFIIGVQFHPEILPQYSNLFKEFIKNCQKFKEDNQVSHQ